MPTTINGVGTHYYGRRNVQTRAGQCRQCGRAVQLTSYDTRLWFVVIFIPVIPLGRKRILDYCPSCRRHYAIDLQKWETARQLEVSGARENFRTSPTPENALAAHQQMLGFHQMAEAAEFEKTMLAQFPENAKICAYLGGVYEQLGRPKEAGEYFNRALALRPDLPAASIGVARGHIRAGQLDEARRLLGFLEQPGAAQLYSLEPLETLARAYQGAGRHREALDLFGRIVEALPQVAQHSAFRKLVKKSEKALDRDQSILPKRKFSFQQVLGEVGKGPRPQLSGTRGLLVLGVLCVVGLMIFVISNEWIRRHRKLYLINSTGAPTTVEITGAAVARNFRGIREVVVPEGNYRAVIRGSNTETVDIEVRDTYFNRCFGHSVWVLNVGGAALIEEIIATYSQNPKPPSLVFHTGKTFEHFLKVTHPFETLPDSVRIDAGASRTLVGLKLLDGQAEGVFDYLTGKHQPSEALNFAEQWLGAHPDDTAMLSRYASELQREKKPDRLDKFLKAGLTRHPVRIEWHRAYQGLHDHPAEHQALVQQYEELLRNEPNSSALLYLRGRLEADRGTARDYFTRATQADPRNPYPLYALAFDHIAAAQWDQAKPMLERAVQLSHDNGLAYQLFVTRLALGEAPALEQEERDKVRQEPLDFLSASLLMQSLAAQNQPDAVWKAAQNYLQAWRARNRGSAAEDPMISIFYYAGYCAGNFEPFTACATNGTPEEASLLALLYIEQGRLEEAVGKLTKEDEQNPLMSFALAVAYRQGGHPEEATVWRNRGLEALRTGSVDAVHAAELLSRGTPPTPTEMQEVACAPQLKALMLCLLAQEYPQTRTDFTALAAALNVERKFPYRLIRRCTDPVNPL